MSICIYIYACIYLTDTKWFMHIISNPHKDCETGTINICREKLRLNLPENGRVGFKPVF